MSEVEHDTISVVGQDDSQVEGGAPHLSFAVAHAEFDLCKCAGREHIQVDAAGVVYRRIKATHPEYHQIGTTCKGGSITGLSGGVLLPLAQRSSPQHLLLAEECSESDVGPVASVKVGSLGATSVTTVSTNVRVQTSTVVAAEFEGAICFGYTRESVGAPGEEVGTTCIREGQQWSTSEFRTVAFAYGENTLSALVAGAPRSPGGESEYGVVEWSSMQSTPRVKISSAGEGELSHGKFHSTSSGSWFVVRSGILWEYTVGAEPNRLAENVADAVPILNSEGSTIGIGVAIIGGGACAIENRTSMIYCFSAGNPLASVNGLFVTGTSHGAGTRVTLYDTSKKFPLPVVEEVDDVGGISQATDGTIVLVVNDQGQGGLNKSLFRITANMPLEQIGSVRWDDSVIALSKSIIAIQRETVWNFPEWYGSLRFEVEWGGEWTTLPVSGRAVWSTTNACDPCVTSHDPFYFGEDGNTRIQTSCVSVPDGAASEGKGGTNQ